MLLQKNRYFVKEKTLSLLFLILACLLGIRILGSELYFLVKLLGGLISIILTLFIFYLISIKTKDLKTLMEKSFIFIFFALSFFLLIYWFNSQNINSFLEIKVTGGVLLFVIYIVFFVLFKLSLTINSLIGLISLCLIPAFALGNMTYSAETFAVFGFLTMVVSSIFFILKLRRDYETV